MMKEKEVDVAALEKRAQEWAKVGATASHQHHKFSKISVVDVLPSGGLIFV